MDISWLFLASALLAAFLCLLNLTSRKQKLPPGPKPWPIIGNLNLLGSIPHQSLDLLSKTYGELMYLKFGLKPVLVVSSPEMVKEFLKIHDSIFASRPTMVSGKYTAYDFSDVLLAPYGPYWKQARKIFATQIFNSKSLDSFEYIRVEERKALISSIHLLSLSGQPFVLRDHLSHYSISTFSRIIFGTNYLDESKSEAFTLENLKGLQKEWFFLNGVFNIGDWIPFLSQFDLQGYVKRMKELYKNFDAFNNKVLDDHLNNNKRNTDMVDIFLQLAEDPNLDIKLTRDNIKALLQDILLGGTNTSITTIEWAMIELMRHPHVIQKAHEELDRVIGKERWVEEDDCSKLPLLEAIIKETLRIHPPATLLPPHYAIKDCKVTSYDVSKGTIVFINVWSIGRNPKYWDSPQEFLPERFLMEKDHIDMEGQNFLLIPFGYGRRSCPGKILALKVVGSILANLLHGFNWKLLPGVKPEDICVEELCEFPTPPKYLLSMIAEPRLLPHLY